MRTVVFMVIDLHDGPCGTSTIPRLPCPLRGADGSAHSRRYQLSAAKHPDPPNPTRNEGLFV